MIADRSKQALINFLESMNTRGTIPAVRVKVWLVAIRAILSDLSPDEEADIRRLDLNAAFQRSYNRAPNKYGSNTLQEYRNRITQAVAEFEKWANNPETYTYDGVVRSVPGAKATRARRSSSSGTDADAVDDQEDEVGAGGQNRLVFQYPLRRDFLARLAIPADLKKDEAKRLAAFIKTLATDFVPEESD
jgi:hypothetical protein